MLLSSQCRSTARRREFVARGKLRQTLESIGERGAEGIVEIEERTFSKDDENGASEELSRFVTLKDFEGNGYHLIAVSVE